MRTSIEMLSISPDGTLSAFPNKVTLYEQGGRVYITVDATHDGHHVVSTVVVERAVFIYHIRSSGILS